jgi:molybdate/tungstate transport system ATP-binding protein
MTLELADLAKAYGDFGVGPVDLTVGSEVLAVLGPSGSGKTTLLSLVAGITDPDSGSIALDGRELVGRPIEDRGVGMVFQDGALFPHMTARENVAYAATDDDRVSELAALLELGDVLDRCPPNLSGGERQRVALARTLAADPDVLLLDEPLSSLDAPIRRRLRDELHDLFGSLDVPVLYVTHDQRAATALGDRIAVLRDGTVEQVGTPSAVLDRPASRFVARFTGTENLFDGRVTEQTDAGARVRVGDVDLRTSSSAGPGTTVTVCIHPSRVVLEVPAAATDAGGDDEVADADETVDSSSTNLLTGTVDRWLNEGTECRVDVGIDAGSGSLTLTATVRPAAFDQLSVETGSELQVLVPQESVHLIPDREESR